MADDLSDFRTDDPLTEEEFDAFLAAVQSCRGPDKPAGECPAPT